MENQPSPQEDFYGFRQPIWSIHPGRQNLKISLKAGGKENSKLENRRYEQ